MAISEKSHIDLVFEVIWYPICRWLAAGLPPEKIQALQGCETELLDMRTKLFMSRRNLIEARAAVAHCDEETTDLVFLLGDALRSAARIEPTVKPMETVFGNLTPSVVVRPEGAGLGTQLDMIDQLLVRGANLPATATFEQARLLLSRLAEKQTTARQSLAQLQQIKLQNQALSGRVLNAKRSAFNALNTLRGELMILFPRNRNKVSSFFLSMENQPKAAPQDKGKASVEENK